LRQRISSEIHRKYKTEIRNTGSDKAGKVAASVVFAALSKMSTFAMSRQYVRDVGRLVCAVQQILCLAECWLNLRQA